MPSQTQMLWKKIINILSSCCLLQETCYQLAHYLMNIFTLSRHGREEKKNTLTLKCDRVVWTRFIVQKDTENCRSFGHLWPKYQDGQRTKIKMKLCNLRPEITKKKGTFNTWYGVQCQQVIIRDKANLKQELLLNPLLPLKHKKWTFPQET